MTCCVNEVKLAGWSDLCTVSRAKLVTSQPAQLSRLPTAAAAAPPPGSQPADWVAPQALARLLPAHFGVAACHGASLVKRALLAFGRG